MILRRLTTAFRKQDWFTVAVETLIVVFGVFIGLQVNNWNEARQDHAIARQLEAGLIADASIILEETRENIATMSDALEAMDALFDSLIQADSVLVEADVAEKLSFAFYLPNHAKRSPALLEAQNDGTLSLLQDKELRHAILRWDRLLQSSAETQQSRREFARAYLSSGVRLQSLIGVIPFEEAMSESGGRNELVIAISLMGGTLEAELAAFRENEEETRSLLIRLGEGAA
ncbi:MAG: hypothetical protein JJ931_12850 [Henriciella sp.]|nr:hypothetical protein [Henriciella sp.]MBO6696296.1 hypothetical protein [Henriciella sp.]